jgi:hypothetical protein
MPHSPQSSYRGERREFHYPLQREEYIRTEDHIIIAARHPRYSLIPLYFSLVLLFAGFHGASAEILEQLETNSTTTNSDPLSTETNTQQHPSSSAAQQEPKTDQTPQPVAPIEKTERFGPQVDPCFTVIVEGDTWLDQAHNYVQNKTCEPAVWFDTFFVHDHVLQDLRPATLIILRNSARWTEGKGVDLINNYRIRYRLPQMESLLKRAKFYVVSESPADKFTTQPGQPVNPGGDPNTEVRKPILGVRADLYTRLRSLVSFDTGIKISIHPDAYIRMRNQYERSFSEVYLIRFSEIPMWQAIEHFTNTVQLDLERKLTTFTLVRWGNNVTFTEGTSGITWNTGISLLTQLTPKSAISYDTNIWGVNHPAWIIQNYRIGSLYRRNFYRPWLFFELAPEVTWPRDESYRRNSVYAFMATLEIQFGK